MCETPLLLLLLLLFFVVVVDACPEKPAPIPAQYPTFLTCALVLLTLGAFLRTKGSMESFTENIADKSGR